MSILSQSPTLPAPRVAQLRAALEARFPGVVRALEPSEIESSQSSQTCLPPVVEPLSDNGVNTSPFHEGQISEVVGRPGAGGCSIVLRSIAAALQSVNTLHKQINRYAVWIDLTGSLYPPAAATLGVPLKQLLLIHPSDLQQALQVVEIILRGGSAHSIVLDIPQHTPPLRLGTYHRLRHRVRGTGCGLCILTPHSIVPTPYRIELETRASSIARLEIG